MPLVAHDRATWDPIASNAPATPPARDALRDATALTSWGLAISRALRARGRDPAPLFGLVGLDVAALSDPEARYPCRDLARLWRLAVLETGDPCFGLEVARHIAPTTFHALGFSILSSTTVREALERVVRYFQLVSDAATMTFEPRETSYRLAVGALHAQAVADEAIDALFAVAVRFCRALTDRRFAPVLVELRHARPPDDAPFARCFRAPVAFGAAANALTLEKHACDERLPGANPELARMND